LVKANSINVVKHILIFNLEWDESKDEYRNSIFYLLRSWQASFLRR